MRAVGVGVGRSIGLVGVAYVLGTLVFGTAQATTFVAMNERTLARASDAIVSGTVTALESVGDRSGGIYTLVTIAVDGRYKGDVGAEIVLKQPGGELADRGLVIPGSPEFKRGERSLLFLSAARDGTARTTALGLGQFRLAPGVAGDVVAERSVSEPVLGGSRMRRLKLARLLRTIDKATRTDPRAPLPLAPVPAEATAPGLDHATIGAFTLMDSPSGRWHEADLGETVVYGVDPAGDPALGPDASNAALDAAFAAWTNVDGAAIALARGSTVELAPLVCDGMSQIIFGDPFDEMPKPRSCSGVLALGGYCTKGRGASEQDVVNGTKFRRIAEGNITFNSGFGGCSFWNQTNLAEVATHEIGHTIGIGHSSERDDEPQPALKDATMYYRAHFDGRGAGLRPDDMAAVRFIYPGTTGGTVVADADGDGIADDVDDCPGDDPTLGLANPSQTDTDGDGMGDLCDACPLVPAVDGVQACQALADSSLRVTDGGAGGTLVWRGVVELPADADGTAPRVLLTAGFGVLVDTASPASGLRRVGRLRSRLLYRSDTATISLKRGRGGLYAVRVTVRGVTLGADPMPVVGASLQMGATTFATSLSCPPRGGHHFTCRG
jgi:hypothetical protein